MKKNLLKGFAFLMLFGFTTSVSFGQNKTTIVKQKVLDANGQPTLLVFSENSNYSLKDSDRVFKEQFKTNSKDTFVKVKSETDQLGMLHETYQQFFNGVKVEFAVLTLHGRNGRVESMSGEYYVISKTTLSPSLSKSQGLQSAMRNVGATHYMWEDEKTSKQLNYSKPEGELVLLPMMDTPGKDGTSNVKLAYKYDIYATQPISRGMLYVDAITGASLFYNSIIKHLGEHSNSRANLKSVPTNSEDMAAVFATGNAATRYSGTQTITTRVISSKYTLRDDTRGNGVNTYNSGRTSSYPSTNFTDTNNDWTAAEFNNTNKDNAALDAHWGAEKTYDYWQAVHSRNSYNGSGAAINSWVHFDDVAGGLGYDNAFWNGSVMTYGDGSSNGSEGNGYFDALTSLDVAAHEIGHAVTSNTADLAYQRESGGLNEGFSDIWGAAVEHFGKGNGNDAAPSSQVWLIGDEIDRRSGSAALRSMSNPTSLGQPDTYGGTYWKNPNCGTPTQSNDYCGVHTNSGVLNYWFYLAVAGGSGTNDIGSAFNVSGIGMTKSAKIAYRTLNVYLTANSTFANARTGAIQSAIDLYGAGGAEEIAVTKAWYAVGVGADYATGGTGGSYCTSQSSNVNDEYISRVQLNTINKSSGGQFYSDYTATSTSLTKGTAYTITITPTWTGTTYSEGYSVWIDYNKDGDFADAGEQVWSKAASKTTPVSGSFTVPTGASDGATRMRVSMKYNGIPTACEAFQYGEVEDYTVTLSGAAADTQAPSAPTSLTTSGTTQTTTDLSWNASTDNVGVTGYDVYQGSTLLGSVTGTSASITSLTASTSYTFKVKAKDLAGNISGFSNTVNVTTLGVPSCSNVNLSIKFDNYPEETSWQLKNNASQVIASGGTYGSQADGSTLNISMGCLDDGCYSLTFLDAYGDGICCSYGNGSYTLTNTDTGATLASGGSFTSSQVSNFCLTSTGVSPMVTTTMTTATTLENLEISVYPNPVKGGSLFVKTQSDDLTYSIINMLGQMIGEGTLNNNEINVSSLKSGMYMIQLNGNDISVVKRFVKE